MADASIGAVILAAGKGTRLKSELPKVLHEVCGRPMLAYVFDACRAVGIRDCVAVVGHGKDRVIETFAGDSGLHWVEQSPQLGTGHAVMVCREEIAKFDHVLVLCGDGPLIRPDTLRQLIDQHLSSGAGATLATAVLDEPSGYGRIWRDASGKFLGIVEHADATDEQRAIREVNPSYYCFDTSALLPTFDQLSNDNAKGEYYITDTFSLMMQAGRDVGAITSVEPEDIYSINSRKDLSRVNDVMRHRILDRLMAEGVTIVDPASTWIDARAEIGNDTTIEPFVNITAPVRIGSGSTVQSFVRISEQGDWPADSHIAGDFAVKGGAR